MIILLNLDLFVVELLFNQWMYVSTRKKIKKYKLRNSKKWLRISQGVAVLHQMLLLNAQSCPEVKRIYTRKTKASIFDGWQEFV